MSRGVFSSIRASFLGHFVRNHISEWPGYQFVPDTGVFHNTKLRLRAGASLLSATLRESPETRQRRRTLKSHQNSQHGQVLVLGNGPSVNNLTVVQIKRFQSFGGKVAVMNGFLFSDLSEKILPDYYFLVDPAYWNAEDPEGTDLKSRLINHVTEANPDCILVQPANYPLISHHHSKYLFVDGRSIAGLRRVAQPNKPWGLPSSVAMAAISTMKFLGFSLIYFAGLDSDSYKNFFIDDLNQVMFSSKGNYFFNASENLSETSWQEHNDVRPMRDWPIRHMADVLYAAAIFMRDLEWLAGEHCINVGSDRTNDSAPRACLLP